MGTVATYLSGDHESCDQLFAGAEEAAAAGRRGGSGRLFDRLRTTVERHLEAGERILFPAIEARMIDPTGDRFLGADAAPVLELICAVLFRGRSDVA